MASDNELADFFTRQYSSFDEFDRYFQRYKDQTYSVFRKQNSESAEKSNSIRMRKVPPEFKYSRALYVCTHYGQPRYRGQGIKTRTKHSATGCEACFTLKYDYREKVLRISKHNVQHNHPTTADTYAKELQIKRLTLDQKAELKQIVALNPKNENLMHMINEKYGKSLSLTDVRHLKSELQSVKITDDVNDLVDNMEELEKHGKVRMVLSRSSESDEAFVEMVAFSTFEMIECFKTFPEVIYMDGTFKSNKNGYPLYQIMVEDGSGQGRPVFYAFVHFETAEILSSMMRIFVDFMGNSTSNIRYAMTDKDNAEIGAIKKALPHVRTLLCDFHVHKAMKFKISQIGMDRSKKLKLQGLGYNLITTTDVACFHKTLEQIKMISPSFFSYLEENWINSVDTWAYHTRLNVSNFCNDTKNKCEGENRCTKNILSENVSIGVAVKRLLLQQKEKTCAATSELVSTWLFRDEQPELKDIYTRFDTENKCERENRGTKNILRENASIGVDVKKPATTEFIGTWLFRDEQPELKDLYRMFNERAVSKMIREHNQTGLISNVLNQSDNCFEVQETSGTNYILQGEPLTCRCPFFKRTTLPCIHCVSVFKAFQLPLSNLISDLNRWLKTNYAGDHLYTLPYTPSVTTAKVGDHLDTLSNASSVSTEEVGDHSDTLPNAPSVTTAKVPDPLYILPNAPSVTTANVGGHDVRHHRTKGVLSRLSVILNTCSTQPFLERIEILESILDVWEENGSVSLDRVSSDEDSDTACGEACDMVGVDSGDVVNTACGVACHMVEIDTGDVFDVASDIIRVDIGGCDNAVRDSPMKGSNVVELGSSQITLAAARGLRIKIPSKRKHGKLPSNRKHGTPRELKAKRQCKVKRPKIRKKTVRKIGKNKCYICYNFKNDRDMTTVPCLRCPRWYHQTCLGTPASEQFEPTLFVCSLCS